MNADELTPRDQLAASLSGMLAAGMGSQPVKMAEMLLDDGWTLASSSSGGREEHIDWITGALAGLGVEDHARDDWAPRLYDAGVRVLGPDEVILSRVDARLLDHVRQAAERWEQAKKRAAGVSADSSDDTPGVKLEKEDQILAALIGAGKPLGRIPAVQAAAGWHRDHKPSPAEWEPWRAAWRRLLMQRRIQRANNPSLGEESTWKPVQVEELNQDG